MASSPSNNPFARQACLPCFNNDDQATEDKNAPNHFQMPGKNSSNNDDITSKPAMKQTEAFLASEMSQMSVEERSKAMDDLHCVGEELQETPEMIQKSLAEFEEAVQKERNPIYEMAINQNRAYVEDPTFRLRFLRAKLYNVREAVRKMMSLLECKAKYFGDDKVARDITLDDLSEEDKQLMLSGLYHIQDGRDQNGRLILHLFGKMLIRCRADNLIRIRHYIMYNIMSSLPDVQRKGIVVVYNDSTLPEEPFTLPGFSFFKEIQTTYDSEPVRFSGIHYCVQAKSHHLALNNVLVSLFLKGTPQDGRARTRIHYGSIMELRYQLQSFGIPLSTIPFGEEGNIRNDILNVWLDRHLKETNQSIRFYQPKAARGLSQDMEIESDLVNQKQHVPHEKDGGDAIDALGMEVHDSMRASSTEVGPDDALPMNRVTGPIEPTEMDVLFGKGYRLQLHPGNVQFREFLEQRRGEYESTPRQHRRDIAIKLAQMLRNKGVRFLQKAGSEEWVESDIEEAETKVAQFFRELRKKRSK
ncbi:unnamed protein product [Cylindrotheca closterium]|uniref:DUF6824 domain-containing protein n=1 Tax=Cylindrotheca closterium TaxID=2856 RepID=A0AAD2CQ86_9STRA|nr:unnamed protein product [Cylindrotheca closterium]CAJ1936712.1 unnamed protein product [Cylindrotheca closterium]